MPQLEKWFAVRLSDLQRVQVLSYSRGDFYSVHSDSAGAPTTPASITNRKVSLVLFLNSGDPRDRHRDYSGGDLNLYNVKPDGGGVKVSGEPGLSSRFDRQRFTKCGRCDRVSGSPS
jgi:predicted 2-oxoglutarate/Fe(II)-dependent dioxygenase YbiX